ncbi:MAG: DUF4132 domain-containing protein [Lachnospiraceae bacterium]|nr:DUF4132 domain-containing protein [Lachnospiraceae bacterium]
MADYDYSTRQKLREKLEKQLNKRINQNCTEDDKKLAKEIKGGGYGEQYKQMARIEQEFRAQKDQKPSDWFRQQQSGARAHQGILDAFVPADYQDSYLYIIDKLNQYPFSYGWQRRTVRTKAYAPQIGLMLRLLNAYEHMFLFDGRLVDFLYRRLDEETSDYIQYDWNFNNGFSLIYAAEIDRGNQAVIDAFKDLILSENNTSYLDQQMILGILRSDNRELHKLLGDLLLAARLQEGLRQAICESMDEGTSEAFLTLLQVIEDNNLLRFSSVKRAVATWIGIFSEESTDRVSEKLLSSMGTCLRDPAYCREQLKTNDSIAISAALWALGFQEANDAIAAMMELIDHGTKNQRLTASYYNNSLFDTELKIQAARKVLLEHSDDLQLAAAFMPAFNSKLNNSIWNLLYPQKNSSGSDAVPPQKPVLTDYFANRAEAELFYEKFQGIYEQLPKKGLTFSPCIFPWYSVEIHPSEVIHQLGFLAYVLQDEEKITEMAARIGEISINGYGSNRAHLLNLLLYTPANQTQRELLIKYMGNGEESTSDKAISIVKRLTLQKDDYRLIEDMLRFKRSRLRGQLLQFLMQQNDAEMEPCIKRLLNDKKEEKRTAGLDLLLRLSKKKNKQKFYDRVKTLAAEIKTPTDKEKVLLEEILGSEKNPAANQKGYGLYDPEAPAAIPQMDEGNDALIQCVPLTEQEIIQKVKKLDGIFKAHENDEYENSSGEMQLLANGYELKRHWEEEDPSGGSSYYNRFQLKNFPLEQELRTFYEQEIGSYSTFVEIEGWLLANNAEIYQNETTHLIYNTLFGKIPFQPQAAALAYPGPIKSNLRLNYRYEYMDKKFLLRGGIQAALALSGVINRENKYIVYHYTGWNGQLHPQKRLINELRLVDRLLEGLSYWETDEEFTKAFYAAWALELQCAEKRERSQFQAATNSYGYGYLNDAMTRMTPYWFLKAYHLKLISKDNLFQAMFHYFNLRGCLQAITQLAKGEYARSGNRQTWRWFFGEPYAQQIVDRGQELVGPDTWCGALIEELYSAMVPLIVDTELRRGEAETEFSFCAAGISYIKGAEYLVRILMALGKDSLSRDTYYSNAYLKSRKGVLSHLLKVCYPAPSDSAETLKQLLKDTSIRADRLVEVAMYAPQWIDLIEEYLGWNGLKSGCYYFMAHMNESFNEQKVAMIARYTPLSPQELQDGAFDIDWFHEAYGLLGEKNFTLLYKAAKYISDGQKHSRARKYADAAAGKVKLKELREQITDKRNKDLLMSYGLVPFAKKREKDLLDRYQFIQQYAKEAKQFGAQRRASEGKAAQTALVNLSVHAGFSDVTRLILNMESRLVEEFAPYMAWHAVDDVELCLEVDELGKSAIKCRKGEKMLKSVPSRLGKHKYVLELKEAHKKLKEQYSRTRKMMEEAMETGEEFTAAEVLGLLGNSVVKAILEPLVYVCGKRIGFVEVVKARNSKQGSAASSAQNAEDSAQTAAVDTADVKLMLRPLDGRARSLKEEEKLRIAHPLDLYRAGNWHSYQKHMFDQKLRQPFKQVFRELYVKMSEELGQTSSRMFAGNQIQPQKTVGCLRGRRWIADYEEGLQKIYYKENIIARIYALADWFSPSDVEAPTLEWVEFSDRKTFRLLTIEQVPDLIYSEVMRDVDLAVSVAHAGGVDPETSHSTIEMRRAIVEFNLPLFGIENVTLKDSHALIAGKRASYNVHLGSGVIHQEGGAMLNILPVHSQSRGKLFLPFVDEDPKTAEIMSKIVLLAEDQKIKDPFILDQIHK